MEHRNGTLVSDTVNTYSSEVTTKNEGPNCVDGKGEQAEGIEVNPAEAPVKAVREK